jgi:hypothetical protein
MWGLRGRIAIATQVSDIGEESPSLRCWRAVLLHWKDAARVTRPKAVKLRETGERQMEPGRSDDAVTRLSRNGGGFPLILCELARKIRPFAHSASHHSLLSY